jgi:3-oxoacyl-[acyl-carrier-protein] synthase II
MQLAIADAGMEPHDIDYINAHGTSTVTNDRIETIAIKKAFGSHAGQLAVSSSKSMLGHMLGAAGAVEAAITGLQSNASFSNLNLEHRDPDCDPDFVPNTARCRRLLTAGSFQFTRLRRTTAASVLKRTER